MAKDLVVHAYDVKNEAILVEDLVKHFGTLTALSGTTFSVPKGGIFGLLGPTVQEKPRRFGS